MAILRPKINLLNDDYKNKILEEAEYILETQGVFIENHEASELLQNEGLKPKELKKKICIYLHRIFSPSYYP